MNDPHGLLLCDDLIFVSRITGTAEGLGLSVRASKSPGELLQWARQSAPRCVIIKRINQLTEEITRFEGRVRSAAVKAGFCDRWYLL